ncbi:50S ribosomal protein L18 [Aliifodinibius salipaludis]|uniref:Large ribosomal subunit protein uL18 n=1 Tax=Fodinibius salipaludis TaxID=2032627 RepID=A0A2A2G4H8_9BACT|nr:50S ribosomal protein L18 [Aliifodinibius salipaludis]PAU92686.1 50S ribosomal protein L18 [Aliifodinibius salipaludis]
MDKNIKKTLRRDRIRRRIRSTIKGTAERPRLSVYKSNKNVYAQLVDDRLGHTLAGVSTESEEIADDVKDKSKKEAAAIVGKRLAEIAVDKGLEKAVFDRSGYKYHGVVKALAEGAREGGLDF